jgi:hypothetical protein
MAYKILFCIRKTLKIIKTLTRVLRMQIVETLKLQKLKGRDYSLRPVASFDSIIPPPAKALAPHQLRPGQNDRPAVRAKAFP